MPRSIALAALAAVLVTYGAAAALAQQGDGPASSSGPTAGPVETAPSPAASADPVPPGSETALSPGGDGVHPVPGAAPDGGGGPTSPASPSPAASAQPGSMVLREGDVVAGRSQDGKVRVMKILKINFIEGDRLLHSLAYKETFHSWEEAQAASDKKALTVLITHLPIDGEGLTPDANRVLVNEPITAKELEGYKEYLREVGTK